MTKYTVCISKHNVSCWYKEGTSILHRENDLPAIEEENGYKAWYLDGVLLREKLADGSVFYYIDYKRYTDAEYLKLTAPTPPDPFDGTTVTIDGKKYKLTFITP